MLRNPLSRQTPDIVRRAKLDVTRGPDVNPVLDSAGRGVNVGQNDDDGVWRPYGLLDLTPLDDGDGFRLSGDE